MSNFQQFIRKIRAYFLFLELRRAQSVSFFSGYASKKDIVHSDGRPISGIKGLIRVKTEFGWNFFY